MESGHMKSKHDHKNKKYRKMDDKKQRFPYIEHESRRNDRTDRKQKKQKYKDQKR